MPGAGTETLAPASDLVNRFATAPQSSKTAPPGPAVPDGRLPLPRLAYRLGLALLALGVLCRLGRYLLRFPIWGDEAMLCDNFLDRDFFGLVTRQLSFNQVAPLLFLWTEKATLYLLGGAEWAMRLPPLLAGVAALVLFWHLARLTLRPLPAAFAVGLLAVARWPVSMSCFVKPYSCDLFFSLALLVPAARWLRRPEATGWLVLLALLGAPAVGFSYPSVFVAGGVMLALAWPAWRQGPAARVCFGLFALITVTAFLAHYLLVGRLPAEPGAADVAEGMRAYWAHAFPPAGPLSLAGWLAMVHAGRMMAYPVGDGHGGSTATLLLFLLGAWTWWRAGRRPLLVMLLAPFALNLAAAFLGKFPYGGCCRLSQHLAPAVCLLAGSGLAALVERFTRTQAGRRHAAQGVCGALALVALGGLAVDLSMPYRDLEAVWNRGVVREVMARATPADQVVVLNSERQTDPLMRWHLGLLGDRVAWSGRVDWQRLQAGGGRLWCLGLWCNHGAPPAPGVAAVLDGAPAPWAVVAHVPYTVGPVRPENPTWHADLYFCVPEQQREQARRAQLISCFP